ncbi:hypothetical protein NN3_00720 [Nocardia neocaledoniensis NBRC 108232]|uniref:Uncharacterized protein n=1 Tax=Nocardia neocaledoniensis TaxID=236511 RepID=A0A317NGW9_9NOCA|nr:hypothetical protein [Nocardia neocaledoniensis]PWV74439.1 hypothetical protein DFR69_106250 [Nocardia neocaledoniensis]GEM29065.1 hypothetical protein NN3_00720 [Nocardia neocaledoniensis NBRC 108232]
MTRNPRPNRQVSVLRGQSKPCLPDTIAHTTIAGLALSSTATALADLSFPATDSTLAREARIHAAVLTWQVFIHHGFHDRVHREFVTGLNQARRRARAMAAFDPLPQLRRYEPTRAVAALDRRWQRRHTSRPTALALLDLSSDVVGARTELVALLAHYGLRPRQRSGLGAHRPVLVEAIAAAALGARHLNLASWQVFDIDALLAPTDPSRNPRTQPVRRWPPPAGVAVRARPPSL